MNIKKLNRELRQFLRKRLKKPCDNRIYGIRASVVFCDYNNKLCIICLCKTLLNTKTVCRIVRDCQIKVGSNANLKVLQ